MQNAAGLAPVVRKVDNTIKRINHYPLDNMVCFVDTYPLDNDLSGGQRYPAFEQPGPWPKCRLPTTDFLSVISIIFKLFPLLHADHKQSFSLRLIAVKVCTPVSLIIIHLTHCLFSDQPKAYSEFLKSAPGTPFTLQLQTDYTKIMPRTLNTTGNHAMYDQGA